MMQLIAEQWHSNKKDESEKKIEEVASEKTHFIGSNHPSENNKSIFSPIEKDNSEDLVTLENQLMNIPEIDSELSLLHYGKVHQDKDILKDITMEELNTSRIAPNGCNITLDSIHDSDKKIYNPINNIRIENRNKDNELQEITNKENIKPRSYNEGCIPIEVARRNKKKSCFSLHRNAEKIRNNNGQKNLFTSQKCYPKNIVKLRKEAIDKNGSIIKKLNISQSSKDDIKTISHCKSADLNIKSVKIIKQGIDGSKMPVSIQSIIV